jgi:Rieske 2Fe-2S family protein
MLNLQDLVNLKFDKIYRIFEIWQIIKRTIMANKKNQYLLNKIQRGWSLPQSFYTDETVFQNDLEQIFFKHWLYVGHTIQLQKTGDYFTYEIGDESIIIIRNKGNQINAFYNVCTHRGSRICLQTSGNAQRHLVCPYHQWAFSPDGELQRARDMGEDFNKNEFHLHRVNVEVFEGLIFICLNENPPSFEPMYRDVLPQLKPVGMNRVKIAASRTYDVWANWKLITENFRECYHCPGGHPEYIRCVEGTASFDPEHVTERTTHWQSMGYITYGVDFTPDAWHHCQRYPFHRGYVTESLDGKPVAPLLGDYTEEDMGTFCIVTHPNFMLESSSDHALTMRMTPVSARHTRMTVTWFVNETAEEGHDYDIANVMAFWHTTGEQDWKLCSDNQAGVNSRAYRPGPYGEKEVAVKIFQEWYLNQLRDVGY